MKRNSRAELLHDLDKILNAMIDVGRSRGNVSWLPAVVLIALWGLRKPRAPLSHDEAPWTFIDDLFRDAIDQRVPSAIIDRLFTTLRGVDETTLRNWFGCIRHLVITVDELPTVASWIASKLDSPDMWAGKGTAPLGLAVPQALSGLAVSLANPSPGTKVLDPSCGTGAFLSAAARVLQDEDGDYTALAGFDLNEEALAIAWLRLHIAGQHLEVGLGSPDRVKADVILCAPLAGVPSDLIDAPWAHYRYRFGSSPRFLHETAITAMSFDCLNPGGRAVLLIPIGLLFRAGEDRSLRKHLLSYGGVEAVISLPAGVLAPLTHIPTALLILGKPEKSHDAVTMIDASDIGLKERRRTILQPKDCEAIVRAFRTGQSDTEGLLIRSVSRDEILNSEFDLRPERYIIRQNVGSSISHEERFAELQALEKEYRALADETDALIEKLVGSSPSAP